VRQRSEVRRDSVRQCRPGFGEPGGARHHRRSRSNNAFAGVDRVVLDRTGIVGDFDFTLEFGLPRATLDAGPPANSDDSAPALGTALREQLGLVLRSTRAPVHVPVIDRIDRPTPD
jgi:uncharacterized protein (TIGR03435 family)